MSSQPEQADIPPTHTIDLSLPPAKRYTQLATFYRADLHSITSLLDDLVLDILPPQYLPWIKRLARLFLRRLHSHEETEEIRGISEATGIEMYLIVSLNVLLDLLMGCTSGAALSDPSSPVGSSSGGSRGNNVNVNIPGGGKRLLHFRTLDWGMPALRKLVVCLEFVRSAEDSSRVLARSITYVGFVGVLTGVRRGLSVSLNFRPNHDGSTWLRDFRYYGSHVLVLLGLRRSVSSILRGLVVPQEEMRKKQGWLARWLSRVFGRKDGDSGYLLSLEDAVSRVARTPSTSCYIILCDGRQVYVLEKDHRTTHIEFDTAFLVATNSDRGATIPQDDPDARQEHHGASLSAGEGISLVDFLKDSIERRECIQAHWDMKVAQARQTARWRAAQNSNMNLTPQARRDPLGRTRLSQRQDAAVSSSVAATTQPPDVLPEPEVTATLDEIVTWTTMYPTTNEMTHFATVMDPTTGTIPWIRRYLEPLLYDWEQDDFE